MRSQNSPHGMPHNASGSAKKETMDWRTLTRVEAGIRWRLFSRPMMDIRLRSCISHNLRPHPQADHISISTRGTTAEVTELKIEVLIGCLEVSSQFCRTLQRDGVSSRADGFVKLEHCPCPGDVLLFREATSKPPFAILWRYGSVVPAVYARVTRVAGSAVAYPDDIPGVAIGFNASVLGVVGSVEGPVDERFYPLG